jgi:hypothetical protein
MQAPERTRIAVSTMVGENAVRLFGMLTKPVAGGWPNSCLQDQMKRYQRFQAL